FGQQEIRNVALLGVGSLSRQADSQAGHLLLREAATARDSLHLTTALVTRGEIAALINDGWILLQLGVDEVDGFEDPVEIQAAQSSQAAESLGSGDAFRRFTAVLSAYDRQRRLLQARFHPGLHRSQRVLVALQLLGKARQKGRFQ